MTPDLLQALERRVPRYTSYPTAPHFTGAIDADAYAGWLAQVPPEAPISLYVHVPFCTQLCWYCGCNTRVVRGVRPLDDFLDLLRREIDLVHRALGGRRRVSHLHLGGGTPNVLDADHLRTLWRHLHTAFAIELDAEVSVEIDPRQLGDAQIGALAELGVNRASLGVQDFDRQVQRAVNRIQPFTQVEDAIVKLRDAGIAAINLDLIYGLPHQTVATMLQTVDLAAALVPDRIALFGYAHVPWMKKHQALIPTAALPDAEARARLERAAGDRLVAYGYRRIGLDHFAHSDDPLAQAAADGRLHRNFQGYTTDDRPTLIGLGPSSIGTLPAGFVQNTADYSAYRAAIAAGRLASARGVALSAEDRLRGEIIERLMCALTVDVAEVARRHGRSPATFGPALAEIDALAAAGIASRDGWRIQALQRPFVRLLCAAFDSYLETGVVRHAVAV